MKYNQSISVSEIKKFLEDSIKAIEEDPSITARYILDDELCLYVGYEGGFDKDKNGNDERICAKIAERNDFYWVDFEGMNMPWDPDTGDVWDTDSEVSPTDADYYVREYKEIRKALDNGEVVLESRKPRGRKRLAERFPWEYQGNNNDSIVKALDNLVKAMDRVVDLCYGNAEGVDINDYNDLLDDCPIEQSFEDFSYRLREWVDELVEAIEEREVKTESKKSAKGRKLTEDEEKIIVHELPGDAYGQDYWYWLTDDDGLYGEDGKNGLIILYDDGRNILKNYTQFSDEELEDVIYEDGANGLSKLIGKEYAEFDIGYYPVGEFSDEWLSELSDVAKGDYTVYEVQNNEDGKYETLIGDTVLTTISKRGSDEEQIAEILGVNPEQIVIKKPRHTYVYDSYQPTKGKRLKEGYGDLSDEEVSKTFSNYKAFEANFKPLRFVKRGNEYFVYKADEKDDDNYKQHGNKDYINGWLYGAVQAKMKMFESKKPCKGKKLDEARPPKVDFDFDEIDIEATDIRELYAEDGVEGVVDLPWKNVKFNYPEFAKIFEFFCNYIYDGDVSIEDCWEYMDEPLYKAVMEYIDTRRKQDPVDLIKKYDKDLKVVLTTSPDPTPEDGDFEDEDDEDDYYYDFSDDEFLSPEEKRQMKDIETSVRSSRKK